MDGMALLATGQFEIERVEKKRVETRRCTGKALLRSKK